MEELERLPEGVVKMKLEPAPGMGLGSACRTWLIHGGESFFFEEGKKYSVEVSDSGAHPSTYDDLEVVAKDPLGLIVRYDPGVQHEGLIAWRVIRRAWRSEP